MITRLLSLLGVAFLLLPSFETNAQGGDCIDPSLINPDAICTFIYDPVCGCDGVTYSNECVAVNSAGVTSWTPGECGTQGGTCIDPNQIDFNIFCTMQYDPVCGCNGITYSNECHAIYYGGVTSWTQGECPKQNCIDESQIDPEVGCFQLWQPVCGCDGVTYANECEAIYYGGVTSFENGECAGGCINPEQINITQPCPLIYDPVCGCDGVTYDNDCNAFYYGGVTSWTPGPCGSQPSECLDLVGADFGDCEAVIGVGQIDGECVTISGCSTVDLNTNQDMAGYIFPNLASCQSSCGQLCVDLAGIDFGFCDFILGVGIVNGECVGISGCDYTDANGYDFSQQIFSTAEECLQICTETMCIDSNLIDPFVLCADIFDPVCGCDSVTYWNQCIAVSWNGVSSFEQGGCAVSQECIVDEQIIENFDCPENIDPVCGCDNVTYQNSCVAFLHYGVQSWTPGPCTIDVPSVDLISAIYPNPFNQRFEVQLDRLSDLNWQVVDLTGRLILSGQEFGVLNFEVNASELASGVYVLNIDAEGLQLSRRLVKE